MVLLEQLLSLWDKSCFCLGKLFIFYSIVNFMDIYFFIYFTHNLLLGFGKEKLLGLINLWRPFVDINFLYWNKYFWDLYMIFGKLSIAIILFKQIPLLKKY